MKDKEDKGDFKIPDEALKKIKSQSELDDFFSDLYKQAVEGMLGFADFLDSDFHGVDNKGNRLITQR